MADEKKAVDPAKVQIPGQGRSITSVTETSPSPETPKVRFSRDEAGRRLTETAAAFLQEIQASYPEEIEMDAANASMRYVRGMAGRGILVDITIRIF